MVKHGTYTASIRRQRDGGYLVTVPALPGCLTWGRTYEEAVNHAREAIECHLEALQKLGRPIPVESVPRRLHLDVRLPVMA